MTSYSARKPTNKKAKMIWKRNVTIDVFEARDCI